MKRLFAATALLGLLAACGTTTQTQIPPGQTFVLGGEQRSELLLEGRNTGTVPVELLREREGQRTSLAVLAPGQLFSRRFAPGDVVLLRNGSTSSPAVIDAHFNHSAGGLTMRYEAPAR